jgi:branched-subunit amino acid aminotransferase/4-amino-4-deoxychorismate lyase
VLIWVGGQIVPDEALTIPVADRTFEHGLGLFETLRTWGGAAPLLPRHLERLTRSAAALGLALDPAALPDAQAVRRLRQDNRVDQDCVLRITLSGGLSEREGDRLWVRLATLPSPPRDTGAVVAPAPWTLSENDPLARHKTLNYWARRLAYDHGRSVGADEVLFGTPDGRIWEGSRTNLFLVQSGTLITPDLSGPVLPGIMRGLVLELAAEVGLDVRERSVAGVDLDAAEEIFLTNSVRGIVPVGRMPQRTFAVPGPATLRLRTRVEQWLHQHQEERPQ